MVTSIKLIKGDITKVEADAIVDAANTTLLGGGGVDGAIHRAAGPELLAECKSLGGCEVGQAKITNGYRLPARFVIHTVGPIWRGGDKDEHHLLRSAYYNSLRLAKEKGLKNIAFPSVSTGAYRFPIEAAARIALNTTKEFLEESGWDAKEIMFVLFSEGDLEVYRKAYEEIFGPLTKPAVYGIVLMYVLWKDEKI